MTTSNPIQIILNENKTNSPMVNIDIIKSPTTVLLVIMILGVALIGGLQ